jgi:hypothetical protein
VSLQRFLVSSVSSACRLGVFGRAIGVSLTAPETSAFFHLNPLALQSVN